MVWDANGYHPLRKICDAWIGKINKGIERKKPWQEIADECEMFFSASTGFLWDPKNKNKFWNIDGGEVKPRFKLTIARAFELVALFGPTLYWRNPVRTATPVELPELNPAAFGNVEVDPQAAMIYQQAQMEYQQETPSREIRADLMSRYMNWTPNILGLHRHAELAITQALVSGRGVLWTMPYQPPGSQKVMVGSFFDPVENLVIDPDAESLDDAWWVAKRCVEPVWKVERDRQMKPGTLQRYSSLESGNQQGESVTDDLAHQHRLTGQSQDLLVYWKVWSRCGLARIKELQTDLKGQLDKVTGDYVYLEVCNNCPFMLNMPSDLLETADNETVQKAFQWPIPFWKRDRWPMQCLDFYARPKKPWPIAPMAPGLGELKAINVLFSHLVNRVWMSMRDFIVYAKSASEEVRKIIEEGRDQSFIPLEEIHNSINDVISFLQQPQVNPDAYKILEYLLQMFDRRVGLSDLLYGLQETQSRSAADVRIREQMVNIRPEYMASKVEEWMSQNAKSEAIATRWFVQGQDVQDLMGKTGAYLWDRYIVESDVERTVDEIDYRVEAGSARRPNRERDQSNMQEFLTTFAPLMSQFAQMTGNTQSLNVLIEKWGKTAEMDTRGLEIPAPPPPPSPEEQQQQMMQQQQMEMQAQQQQAQMEFGLKQQEQQGDLAIKQAESQTKIAQLAQEFALKMQQLQQEGQIKLGQAQADATLETRMQRMELLGKQKEQQIELQGMRQKLVMQKQADAAKVTAAKKMAAAKPAQTNGSRT